MLSAVSCLGALAALVSLAFACCTAERYLTRRRPHELAWTQSLCMFAAGSLAYWAAGAGGWEPWNFRAFYLFGAILNVPYLAVGTIYLLGGDELGRRLHRRLHVAAGFCSGALVVTPLLRPLPRTGLPEGRAVFGIAPRVMAAVGSGLGATVLILGALWSAWKLLATKRRPALGAAPTISPARLAATNLLIAAGSIVLSLGGTVFTSADREVGFGILLVVGIGVLFAGFLVSGTGAPASTAALPTPPEGLDEFGLELWELIHAPADPPNGGGGPPR
ncbi:MAG: hypothetical protein IT195_09535 [Microthrixaceae bacterium]|nr:hypothetical protein [Microthrixaceae bacterium]